ncbi:MAG: hypothetical protein WCP34_15700 [Pseudomonadota bacterium]
MKIIQELLSQQPPDSPIALMLHAHIRDFSEFRYDRAACHAAKHRPNSWCEANRKQVPFVIEKIYKHPITNGHIPGTA